MCGICGIVSTRGVLDRERLAVMSVTLTHREHHVEGITRDAPLGQVVV